MKLFYFKANGYGAFEYFVMAETEQQAQQAVTEYIEREWGHNEDFPKKYSMTIAEPLEVIHIFTD